MSDADIEAGNPLLSHSRKEIFIKVKHQNKDYEVSASPHEAVSDLIIKFRQLLPPFDTLNKNIRLIYSGKLLSPPSALLSNFKIIDGSFIHAVVNDIPNGSAPAISPIANSSLIVGGFDVLLSDGLSIDEVAAIRSYFRVNVDEFAQSNPLLSHQSPNETPVQYRSRIESVWIQAQEPYSEFYMNLPVNSSINRIDPSNRQPLITQMLGGNNSMYEDSMVTNQGTFKDFFWGLVFGIVFGFLALICIWERNITYRQKMGILVGVMINISVSVGTNNDANSKS